LASVLLIILGNLVYDQGVFTSSTRDAFAAASMANQSASFSNSLPSQLRTALIPARDSLREITPQSEPQATRDSLNKVLRQLEKLAGEFKDLRSNDKIKKIIAAIRIVTDTDITVRLTPSDVTPLKQLM